MISFLIFNLILGITPGPNNTLALSEGRLKGFVRSQPFVWAAVISAAVLASIAGLAATLFQRFPLIMTIIRIAGTLYLLYLAWHILQSKSGADETGEESGLVHPIRTGFALQFVNPKAYVAIVTSLSVMAKNVAIPLKIVIMLVIIYGCIALWVGLGQALRQLFVKHGKLINLILAVLLVFSAVDLWL